jgi:hypothetical protein
MKIKDIKKHSWIDDIENALDDGKCVNEVIRNYTVITVKRVIGSLNRYKHTVQFTIMNQAKLN